MPASIQMGKKYYNLNIWKYEDNGKEKGFTVAVGAAILFLKRCR